MSETQPVFLGVTNEAAAPRARLAWSMRQAGATYVEIGAGLGVTPARARQIVIRADLRMARACAIYDGPVVDPIAYGVWHVFDHDGRVTRA